MTDPVVKAPEFKFDPRFDTEELTRLVRFFADPLDSRIMFVLKENFSLPTDGVAKKLELWYPNIVAVNSRVGEILRKLAGDGYVHHTKDGWSLTQKGTISLIKLDQFIERITTDEALAKPKPVKRPGTTTLQ